ncbi:UPF0489 protein C5orf22 homolog isoform X2 [Babylonia areolata]|uniref:UPF0489 protein C5orf22 homolog isoform X2 n=1 Tax=Babylonia areolata TaxID=304850 RepID=UPI003FD3493F
MTTSADFLICAPSPPTMRRIFLRFPRQLKLKTLCVLVTVVSLVLVGITMWLKSDFSRVRYTLRKVQQSRLVQRMFAGPEGSEEDLSSQFMKLERQWKEPEWEVADVLRRKGAGTQQLLPVVVVEEHHEVLKYWFDAVDTGVIPKKGNTLLHIDGHSDGAPPRDLSLVPWFRLPRNHSEVANMMQSNDVFIASAAMTGVISRYIWVWPEWDRPDHTEERDHEVSEIIAGWRIYYPTDGKPFQRHCACIRPVPTDSTDHEDWECWDDEPDPLELGEASLIKSKKCQMVMRAVMETIHEEKALELLKGGNWIRPGEKVLLDIDEDYFGCESSIMPLFNAGWTKEAITHLSDLVDKFLCANDVHYEFFADKIFRTIVQNIRDYTASLCENDPSKRHAGCLSESEADKALIQMMPKIAAAMDRAGTSHLLCNGKASEVILQIIIRSLMRLNVTQLDALHYVGICMETSPSSMMYVPNSLHVCHGFNIPGETQVSFHVPTVQENMKRSALLRSTLSLLPQQPRLVTVCRSMRDGYTPWRYFSTIERSIMDVLKSVFMGVKPNSVHYDHNLLGGKKGWPERHQR